MKVRFGKDLFGRWETSGANVIVSQFLFVANLPLWPISSFEIEDGQLKKLPKLHLGSVAASFIRSWGVILSLALIAWGVYLCDRNLVSWSTFIAVPVAALVALLLTIASFLWFGVARKNLPSTRKSVLYLAIPALVVGSFFGYWWRDRHLAESKQEARDRDRGRTADDARREEFDQQAHLYSQASDLIGKLRVVAVTYHGQNNWDTDACDPNLAGAVPIAAYSYLVDLADFRRGQTPQTLLQAAEASARENSQAISDFGNAFAANNVQASHLQPFNGPLVGVINLSEAVLDGEPAAKAWLSIHALENGEAKCRTSFVVHGDASTGKLSRDQIQAGLHDSLLAIAPSLSVAP